MSMSFGVGDFLALGQLAWSVYKSCKDAAGSFQDISLEVLSLHAVIKEFEDNLQGSTLPSSQRTGLESVAEGCRNVLKDLQTLTGRYHSLGTKTKRTYDRLAWGQEDITGLRSRLISNTVLLNAFISTSQIIVQNRLERYLNEVRQGHREGSVLSNQSLSSDDKATWREIRKELEDIGISVAAIRANKAFIIGWFDANFGPRSVEEHERGESDAQPPDTTILDDNLSVGRSDDSSESFAATTSNNSCSAASVGVERSCERPSVLTATHSSAEELGETRSSSHGIVTTPTMQRVPTAMTGFGEQIPEQVENRRAIGKWLKDLFFDAVADGSIEALKSHLANGASVTWVDHRGRSPLHIAASRGYDDVVEELVRAGGALEARNTKGATPLHDAARGGHASTVEMLIENGADIETKEPKWRKCREVTALVIAVIAKAEEVACVLLGRGAKVNYLFDFQQTILHVAVIDFKSAHTFTLLLQAAANPHARNGGGRTPLHTAASWGNRVAVKSLLDAGAKINPVDSWQHTPLHMAAWNKHEAVVQMLLDHGANAELKDNTGRTAKAVMKKKGFGKLIVTPQRTSSHKD
ncbi:MAG: hypothetical protein Q9177_000913 [Variospora cf. flavescens]